MKLKKKIQKSIEYLEPLIPEMPETAIVLGSGLGGYADTLKDTVTIKTESIPHYPVSTVPGHKGQWVIGNINGTRVLAVQGRVHRYEGYTLKQVTYPVQLMASMGVKNLVLTTASGGLNPDFTPGDLMLITDHINFGFGNPLIGKPDNLLGPRFPDMTEAYNLELRHTLETVAERENITLQKGVFCWVTGPNYETAAEVRMLRMMGGDAVSMSTVPEVIVANQRHMNVLGISIITNLATGLAKNKLTHSEVTEMADKAGEKLSRLLTAFAQEIGS